MNDLREPEKVRASQEKALQALQHYTLAHYPDMPSKFGELLLRIPELQRTCQVGYIFSFSKGKRREKIESRGDGGDGGGGCFIIIIIITCLFRLVTGRKGNVVD